jgi:hypothetical protein
LDHISAFVVHPYYLWTDFEIKAFTTDRDRLQYLDTSLSIDTALRIKRRNPRNICHEGALEEVIDIGISLFKGQVDGKCWEARELRV